MIFRRGKCRLQSLCKSSCSGPVTLSKKAADSVKITAPVTPPCPLCKGPTRKRKGKMVIFGVHTLSGL